MEKIGIVGYGYVGKAIAELLKEHYELKVYDPLFNSSQSNEKIKFADKIEGLSDCILGIVCVPTPEGKDGECDLSLIEEAVSRLSTPVILIKSTIEPGTTEKLKRKTGKRIVFSPEHIGESKYWNPYFNNDMKATPFVILGGDKEDRQYVYDILLPILGPTKTYFQTTSANAEMIKYLGNCFFATKVTFVNEMYNICKAVGADWDEVREGWLLDPRVEKMHTAVFPKNRGFGGKCFPKDLSALISASRKAGYNAELLEEVRRTNNKFRADKK